MGNSETQTVFRYWEMIIYQQDHHQHCLSPLLFSPPILIPLLSNHLKKEVGFSIFQFQQFAKSLYSRETSFTELVHKYHLLQLGFICRDASVCSGVKDLYTHSQHEISEWDTPVFWRAKGPKGKKKQLNFSSQSHDFLLTEEMVCLFITDQDTITVYRVKANLVSL